MTSILPPLAIILALAPALELRLAADPAAPAGYLAADGTVHLVAARPAGPAVEALNRVASPVGPPDAYTVDLGNNYSAASSLLFDASLVAPMTAELTLGEITGFTKLLGAEPLGIRIAHAPIAAGATFSSLVVVVSPQNPLDHLTLAQGARIFASGSAKGDFSHWSQVGVKGPLAEQEIQPCGLPESDDAVSEDTDAGGVVLLRLTAGAHFTGRYSAYPNYRQVLQRVAGDPSAIGIVAASQVTTAVKVLKLARDGWSRPVSPSASEISAGHYPLDRYLYLYIRRVPGQPLDARAVQYVKTALSPAGQAAIASSSTGFLPLCAADVSGELAKLP